MDNYYEDLRNRAMCYRNRFSDSPRAVALRMIWWNFKSLFKRHIQQESRAEPSAGEHVAANGATEEYIRFLENQKKTFKESFVPICEDSYERRRQDTKVIAWYLPQYYPMEVNDRFHGKGFTEWTSTTQAIPLYSGHYQPRVPYDLGYYTLLDPRVMARQVELAKQYGVYGFCFHWYWFSGQRTMEKPVEMYLRHTELDLPFCINWANENWTALWDGENKNLIFEQRLDEKDDLPFINDLIPLFKDHRYIKINGCPLLSIYYCNTFDRDRFSSFLTHCRDAVKKEGFPDLYVMLTTGNDFNDDPAQWGADALVEYAALIVGFADRKEIGGYLNPDFKGQLWDYPSLAEGDRFMRELHSAEYYRSAMVGFDNSARKASQASCHIMDGATPASYKKWMKKIIEESKAIHSEEKNMVFVLAWNEWAEAAYLEPDMKFGYGFLRATREAIEESRTLDETIILEKIAEKQTDGIQTIHFVVHCVESLGDIIACEPIARYLKEVAPGCRVTWLVRENYKDIVAYNPFIDEVVTVDCLGTSIALCKSYEKARDAIIVNCHYDGRWCVKTKAVNHNPNNPMVNEETYFNYGPLLTTFCLSAGLPALKTPPVFHESGCTRLSQRLPEKYAVIHATAAEECKAWGDKKWNELTEMLLKTGLSVVEIGLTPVVKNSDPAFFDCTDIHNIQEIAQIIKHASCFFGVDSAFAHLANCFKIPGIVILGQYKNFDRYVPYTGDYGDGKNSVLVYADNGPAARVSVGQVEDALEKLARCREP